MAETEKKFIVRFAANAKDIRAAQILRYRCFNNGADGVDEDQYDAACQHILIEDASNGELISTCRLMHLPNPAEIEKSYSAQYYGLSALRAFEGAALEMGRFCISPEVNDPTVLRLAWSEVTKFVDQHDIGLLFGCSSFEGTSFQPYEDAFALLKERHIAPRRWLPRPKARTIIDFAKRLRPKKPNLKLAQKAMPPLLRTYLTMGGWVSDHAVVDKKMNTLHVFTGVEIKLIPPARKRLLRMDAG